MGRRGRRPRLAGDAARPRRGPPRARGRLRPPVGAGVLARHAVAAPRVAPPAPDGRPREPLAGRLDAGPRAGGAGPAGRARVELARRCEGPVGARAGDAPTEPTRRSRSTDRADRAGSSRAAPSSRRVPPAPCSSPMAGIVHRGIVLRRAWDRFAIAWPFTRVDVALGRSGRPADRAGRARAGGGFAHAAEHGGRRMSGKAVVIDGQLLGPDDAKVSVYDRGFLFGDAVFEVLRTYGGALFAWDEHYARLRRSAGRVFIDVPVDGATLRAEVERAVAATGNDESNVRIVLTRGTGPGDARSRDGGRAAPRGPRRAGRSPAARGVRGWHRGRHRPHAAHRGRDRRVGREGDELPREPAGRARGEGTGRAGGARRRRRGATSSRARPPTCSS